MSTQLSWFLECHNQEIMGKIGKKELKTLQNTLTANKFFDMPKDEVKVAKLKLAPKPAKKKASKKK